MKDGPSEPYGRGASSVVAGRKEEGMGIGSVRYCAMLVENCKSSFLKTSFP